MQAPSWRQAGACLWFLNVVEMLRLARGSVIGRTSVRLPCCHAMTGWWQRDLPLICPSACIAAVLQAQEQAAEIRAQLKKKREEEEGGGDQMEKAEEFLKLSTLKVVKVLSAKPGAQCPVPHASKLCPDGVQRCHAITVRSSGAQAPRMVPKCALVWPPRCALALFLSQGASGAGIGITETNRIYLVQFGMQNRTFWSLFGPACRRAIPRRRRSA
jgi:hypothetical protein